MNLAMKRLLPLLAIVACGCSQAVDNRVSESGPVSHENPAPLSLASENAANQGGQTAASFPSITPPTDKASVTPNKYWVNLEALNEGHEAGHEGEHGGSHEVPKEGAAASEHGEATAEAGHEGHEGHEGH